MPTLGFRRRAICMMSLIAAPVSEVATPMVRGSMGISRLRAGSNSPSAASFFLSASNLANRSPCPALRMALT